MLILEPRHRRDHEAAGSMTPGLMSPGAMSPGTIAEGGVEKEKQLGKDS
jgi:hypothetical protein